MPSGLRFAFRQPLLLRHGYNAAVLRPQPAVAQPSRREQMDVAVADVPAHQLVAIDQKRPKNHDTLAPCAPSFGILLLGP
jgi:hypothetical protein